MLYLAREDVDAALGWGRRAADLEPEGGSQEHLIARYLLDVVLFYRDPDEAEAALREFLAAVPDGEQDVRRYFAMSPLSEPLAVRGEVAAAEELAATALEVTDRQSLHEHPPTEQVHTALGITRLFRGQVDAAEEHLERAVAPRIAAGSARAGPRPCVARPRSRAAG